jgi:uncharacterized membrane protein YciS (DUF1049 family)
MNTYIIESIKVFLVAYTISRFTPIQMVLDLLPNKLHYNLLKLLMTCSKCLGLWVGLIMTGNIWLSMGISLFMVVFEKTFGEWEMRTKLN